MSALETYLKELVESTGLLHQKYLQAARQYIRESELPELRTSIRRIKDPAMLRALWECGLSTDLQIEVIKRIDEIVAGKE